VNDSATLVLSSMAVTLGLGALLLRLYSFGRELRFGKDRRKRKKQERWWQDQNLLMETTGILTETVVFALGLMFFTCPTCTVGDDIPLTVLGGVVPTIWWIDCIIRLDVVAVRTSTLANLDFNNTTSITSTLRWARYRAFPLIVIGLLWGFLAPNFLALSIKGKDESLLVVRVHLTGIGFLNSCAVGIALILLKDFKRAIDSKIDDLAGLTFRDPLFEQRLFELRRKITFTYKIVQQNIPMGAIFFLVAAIPGLSVLLGHYFILLLMILGLQITFGFQYLTWMDYGSKTKSMKSAKVGAASHTIKTAPFSSAASSGISHHADN